jgi:hypothetical protein
MWPRAFQHLCRTTDPSPPGNASGWAERCRTLTLSIALLSVPLTAAPHTLSSPRDGVGGNEQSQTCAHDDATICRALTLIGQALDEIEVVGNSEIATLPMDEGLRKVARTSHAFSPVVWGPPASCHLCQPRGRRLSECGTRRRPAGRPCPCRRPGPRTDAQDRAGRSVGVSGGSLLAWWQTGSAQCRGTS